MYMLVVNICLQGSYIIYQDAGNLLKNDDLSEERSKPSLSFKVHDHDDSYSRHPQQRNLLALVHTEFRHIIGTGFGFKMHAVDARNKGERNNNGGNDRQHFHHLIHLITHIRHIQILQVERCLPITLACLDYLNSVVVNIAQKQLGMFGDQIGIIPSAGSESIAQRPDSFMKLDYFAAYLMNLLQLIFILVLILK